MKKICHTSTVSCKKAQKVAHKAFARLVRSGRSLIYTDTCFNLAFICQHSTELAEHQCSILVTKSVQLELKNKRKQPWAARKNKEIHERRAIFKLLPMNKDEAHQFYHDKESAYADGAFEQLFSKSSEAERCFLTADRKLATKLSALPSPPTIFFQYTPRYAEHTSPIVVLWADYCKMV